MDLWNSHFGRRSNFCKWIHFIICLKLLLGSCRIFSYFHFLQVTMDPRFFRFYFRIITFESFSEFFSWSELILFLARVLRCAKVGAQKRFSIGRALAAPWLAEWRLRALDSILLSDSSSRAKKENLEKASFITEKENRTLPPLIMQLL